MFEPDMSSTQFEPSSILKDIQTKQEADPFCSNIIAYLSNNSLPSDSKLACETITSYHGLDI